MSEQALESLPLDHVNYTTKYLVVQSDVSQLFGFLQLQVNSLVILFLMNFSDIVRLSNIQMSQLLHQFCCSVKDLQTMSYGPITCFGLTCEVEMAFTFLIVGNKIQIRIVFCDE